MRSAATTPHSRPRRCIAVASWRMAPAPSVRKPAHPVFSMMRRGLTEEGAPPDGPLLMTRARRGRWQRWFGQQTERRRYARSSRCRTQAFLGSNTFKKDVACKFAVLPAEVAATFSSHNELGIRSVLCADLLLFTRMCDELGPFIQFVESEYFRGNNIASKKLK